MYFQIFNLSTYISSYSVYIMSKVLIDVLKVEQIPVISEWLFKEWYLEYLEWNIHSLNEVQADLLNYITISKDRPFMIVATDVKTGKPVGCASVDVEELPNLPVCFKDVRWLTDVYVDKRCRGKGIAKKIVNFATVKAKELGFTKLQLITLSVKLYESLGWNANTVFTHMNNCYTHMILNLQNSVKVENVLLIL